MSVLADIRTSARFAGRELRHGVRGFRIFLACLIFGIAAIAAVGSVKSSIESGLEREGATILGGDIELEFTYRDATSQELDWIESAALSHSRIIDFRSMVVVNSGATLERALTQVSAIDDLYPLNGRVLLSPDIPLAEALASSGGLPGAVLEPLLANRLELSVGDTFQLGQQAFVLSALLESYPDSAGVGFTLGPRSIVLSADLTDSGLLGEGTLYATKYRLNIASDVLLAPLQSELETQFPNAGIRWRDTRNAAPGLSRFVERIGSFLVLVGLSGLIVGGVGISSAVTAYLTSKSNTIATLKTLGAERRVVFLTYFLQTAAISLLGISMGLALGAGVPILISPLLQGILPIPVEVGFHLSALIEASIYGALTALVFTLWPLANTENIRATTLFRDGLGLGRRLPRFIFLVSILALFFALIFAAAYFSQATELTLWTFGGLIAAIFLLSIAAFVVRKLAYIGARTVRYRPYLRASLAAISAPNQQAGSAIISLGIGLSVLSAIGQIDGNLRQSIAGDLPDLAPSFFVVDIQKDQIESFLTELEADARIEKFETAPMIRGVITQINDRPAKDVAGDHWVIRGDRGISFAQSQPTNANVIEGEWWGQDYDGPPLISFAAEEAEEIGLTLGDTMTLSILGREITATIANFREVDFSNAGMGFVLTLNADAISAAPHTYIATLYGDQQADAGLMRDFSARYPNITMIGVRDAIDRVAKVLDEIANATSLAAVASLITGLFVLIGAAAAGEPARVQEAAIFRSIGATRRGILFSFALRSLLIGTAAGIVALGAGLLGGWSVMVFVMEDSFSVNWSSAVMVICGGAFFSLAVGLIFAWRPLEQRPAQVLRARG